MICYKEEVIITQDECDGIKQAYLEYCTKEKGWQISETTTYIAFKKKQWLKLDKKKNETVSKPKYNDDLYEDWMMFDKGEE